MVPRFPTATCCWVTLLALGIAAPAFAQQPIFNTPGYLVIRVNISGSVAAGGGATVGAPATGVDPMGNPMGSPVPMDGFTPVSTDGFVPGPGGAGPMPMGGAPVPVGGVPTARPTVTTKSVVAVVPYQKIIRRPIYMGRTVNNSNPNWPALVIEPGVKGIAKSPLLFMDNQLVQVYPISGVSLEQRLNAKFENWKKNKTYDAIHDLTTVALSVGLIEKAESMFQEMARMVETRKDLSPPARVLDSVKAYNVIKERFALPLPAGSDEIVWQERFRGAGIVGGTHYGLIHFGEQVVSEQSLRRRLAALDKNFKAFYLWQALLGNALPIPTHRLLAVLAERSSDLTRVRQALDGHPIVSDSFYSPTHNIVVLSPERMDDGGRAFSRYVQGLYQVGWSREDLIEGKAPPLGGALNITVVDIAKMMTLALVDRTLEEEADLAAASREGTRQLYSVTGLLAPHVQLPNWVEYGAVNLFTKPKGPVVNPGPTGSPGSITVGLIPGYGSPNYVLIRHYRDLAQKRELNPNPTELLRNTILDRYFTAARDAVNIDATAMPGGINELPLTGEIPLTGGFPGGAGGAAGAAGMPPGGIGGGFPPAGGIPPAGGFPMPPGSFPPGSAPPGGAQPAIDPATARRNLQVKLSLKAEVTSWALMYYLSRTRSAGLYKFYAELGKLPRDMWLAPEEVMLIFGKSFNLLTPDQTRIDDKAFTTFANSWLLFMNAVNPSGVDIPLTAFTSDVNAAGQNTGMGINPTGSPMGPMGPAGIPMQPGSP